MSDLMAFPRISGCRRIEAQNYPSDYTEMKVFYYTVRRFSYDYKLRGSNASLWCISFSIAELCHPVLEFTAQTQSFILEIWPEIA